MQIDHPFHFTKRGRTATTTDDDHVQDMLEQLLLTAPGERVNRPDFGCGLGRKVFEPNSPELASALQFQIQAAIQAELATALDVAGIGVEAIDATLHVAIPYTVRRSGRRGNAVVRSGAP
jgi:uncharacterized protein